MEKGSVRTAEDDSAMPKMSEGSRPPRSIDVKLTWRSRSCRLVAFLLLLRCSDVAPLVPVSRRPVDARTFALRRRLMLSSPYSRRSSSDENIVDAVIEDPEDDSSISALASSDSSKRRRKRDVLSDAVKGLTELSLLDYQWRSSLFKSNEADRLMEESLARMRGEDASYVRPMDASDEKIGPLGQAERDAVTWLSRVIEEEGKRAERIVRSEGKLVRPIDSVSSSSDLGPLADLEKQAVEFINRIRDAEKARVMSGTMRPKDMDKSMRGPLGEVESRVMEALREIRESEELRYNQTQLRDGQIVRPIDVPGPLGEIERAVGEVMRAEQLRNGERESNEGKLVRPMEASVKGPLGDCEEEASKAFKRLTDEERDRLRNVQRFLEENRPMESNRNSLLGIAEALVVGVLRAPRLLTSVVGRVKELMDSDELSNDDQEVLDAQYKLRLPSSPQNDIKKEEDGPSKER